MLRQDAAVYKEHFNEDLLQSSSSLLSQPLLAKDNPIQLAALSNYKLAQLTFSAPDWNSLRKTALIKNMTEVIYTDTPAEWLDQMCRWQFFSPESLANMTQDGLEHIFSQYIQTIEAFKPINLNDDEDEDEDDEDDEVWLEDEILTPDDIQLDITTNSTAMPLITEYPLYAHSGASISVDLFYQKELKPLPDRPTSAIADKDRRKSIASIRNRLSWTSDTGLLPNSLIGHTWANELMTMFNMEFKVDTSLTLNTAPKLPELPFSSRHNQHKRRSQMSQRYSTDSFMNLIPAFETFKLEEPGRRLTNTNRPLNMTFPPPPPTAPPSTITSRPRSSSHPVSLDSHQHSHTKPRPTRSSSLKHNNHHSKQLHKSSTPRHRSMDIFNGLVNVFSGATGDSTLTKKKSIRRLASLVTGTSTKSGSHNDDINIGGRHRPSLSSLSLASLSSISSAKSSSKHPSPSNIYQAPSSPISNTLFPTGSVLSHLSIISTSPASSSTSVGADPPKTSFMHYKPLPEIPSPSTIDIKRRKSLTSTVPTIVKKVDLQRSKSVGYRPNKDIDTLKAAPSIIQGKEDSNSKSNHSSSPKSISTSVPTPLIPSTQIPQVESDNVSPKGPCMTDCATTSLASGTTASSPSPQPKRSRSTLMKLSSELTRRRTKGQKKTNTTNDGNTENNFVTRMASLGKRMKLQRT